MANRPRQGLTAGLLIGPATGLVIVTLLVPLALLARYSLNRYDRHAFMVEALTLDNYLRFVTDPFYTNVFERTVGIALSTTVLCLVLAFPIAYRLARTQSRWKSIGLLAVILPLFIGGTVRALGWMGVLGRGGLVDAAYTALGGPGATLLYTTFAVSVGILSINLPYMILTLQSVIEGIDIRLEEAAENLGADPARRFWHVILPLSLPGIGTGSILVFILAMNAYATPYLLGGSRFQMMAPMLYREYAQNNNWPFAAAIAFILMITTLALTGLSSLVVQRRYKGR
ncbi:putative spermidine/putrescine transport system permease protein [Bosea sp. 62]|nr:putative spermidine/putrescine transport system permease protein [Bosea sp. 46]CAD5265239.1 putative spermidine/putrescine transport system permease protein [Bosea sp. 21B]CAD5275101.1 putative spermidine/putrescine transport system permease protein [Bosea sp. 7B]VVT59190.1 ABC transporter permease [Bosea sp. EC-HK365B]VXB72935.1 putative spermidine/putrescine transport system permease protein [Bosea sp. 29B]VXC12330.1 putative spermidine/putrescine transport system permease protein [Bosea 